MFCSVGFQISDSDVYADQVEKLEFSFMLFILDGVTSAGSCSVYPTHSLLCHIYGN